MIIFIKVIKSFFKALGIAKQYFIYKLCSLKQKTMKISIISIVFAILFCSACTQQTANTLETLDTKSSREVTIKAEVAGDSILHLTHQKIWVNGQIVAQKTDTIKTAKEITAWGEINPISLVKTPIYVTVE